MKEKLPYLILRVSLGAVFLIFGIGKFQNDIWGQTIKSMDFFIKLPWSLELSVLLIGIAEAITGFALITGLFTRFFAGLAATQLIAILFLLKFQEMRDIGLLGAAVYMLLTKDNSWNITAIFKKPLGRS